MLQTSLQFRRSLRRPLRMTLTGATITFLLFILYLYTSNRTSSITIDGAPTIEEISAPAAPSPPPPPPPTVNLVLATIAENDISWASALSASIPNLTIIRYVADDQTAPYHPAQNKGREATMYHTYFSEFYDNLPDISILTHAEDNSWHAEQMLSASLQHALTRLDLQDVLRRGYVNLRVSWQGACPDWIDTTVTEPRDGKTEEIYMREAFIANFAPTDKEGEDEGEAKEQFEVPRSLNQPCCSQFAVTRDLIRSIPRSEYERYISWLLATDLPDHISGRTWEHMWQYLFTRRAVDCPLEWKVYCSTFHICFENGTEYQRYTDIMKQLKDEGEQIKWVPGEVLSLDKGVGDVLGRLGGLMAEGNRLKAEAFDRGEEGREWRERWVGDLYGDDDVVGGGGNV